jgi:MobA/MobL family.
MRNVTCKTSPVSRAQGHSAVGGAAYRAGENLKAEGAGKDGADKWFRYSGRQVVVREAFIMAPKDAPEFVFDRGELWNTVEAMETRSNARLGREVQLGLAWELSHDEQRALVREFAQKEFVDRGFVVDIAIHNYGRTIPSIGASEEQAERIREFASTYPMLERSEAQGISEPHLL